MDVAALSLNIDSSSVLKAANDLDRFAAAAAKASAGAGSQGGSIAKLVASIQSMDSKLGAIVSGVNSVNAALASMAKAGQSAAAANDNVAKSLAVADSHVIAYTQHLASLATAQQQANAHVVAYQQQIKAQAGAQADANAHVIAYRNHIAGLSPAMDKAAVSAGALQANTGNIAAQFQDIGVTAAMGMNPLIIGLQQGTQLSAVFAQSGGRMRDVLVGAFRAIASAQAIATIGLTALAAVVIQLGIAWFNSSSEADALSESIEKIKFASDGVGDAQTILGRVFDLTTGKMKVQEAAAINLARAQLLLMRATAQNNISKAAGELDTAGNLGFMGRLGAYVRGDRSLIEGSARVDMLTKALKSNQITGSEALKGFQMLKDRGDITEEMFLKGSVAAANYGAEIANVATATKALADLERGKLSAEFMNPNKPRKPGKSEAQKQAEALASIYQGAEGEIAIERARDLAAANSLGALEAAKLEKQTALLNSVQQRGIPITEAIRKRVGELAAEYAKVKTAADVSEAVTKVTDDVDKQRAAVVDQTKLVGLYGDELARARREMEAQQRLADALPKGEIVKTPNLTGGLSDDIEANARAERMAQYKKDAADAAFAMEREAGAMRLTGAAAIQYAYVTERLVQAKQASINLSPQEIAAIEAAGEAYARQRFAIDQHREAVADAREGARGFFMDWMNGAREGANVFTAFADSAVNALNRVIDKLLDRSLDAFLDGMFSGGGGLFGGRANAVPKSWGNTGVLGGAADYGSLVRNALGGVYGAPQRFAQGGAFTNTIVSTPTLFRFANGGALGEMGEAGPEAIMPLKRGANGSLGVQVHGGKGRAVIRMGDYNPSFSFAGAVGLDGIAEMVRQGGEATYNQMKRDLQSLLEQLDADGAFAS